LLAHIPLFENLSRTVSINAFRFLVNHRLFAGAPVAAFMQTIKQMLE
jgi:hypothetical protein